MDAVAINIKSLSGLLMHKPESIDAEIEGEKSAYRPGTNNNISSSGRRHRGEGCGSCDIKI